MCAGLFAGVEKESFPTKNFAHLRAVPRVSWQRRMRPPSVRPSSTFATTPMGLALPKSEPNGVTVAQEYENWIATREPPLFGTGTDARVALANESRSYDASGARNWRRNRATPWRWARRDTRSTW